VEVEARECRRREKRADKKCTRESELETRTGRRLHHSTYEPDLSLSNNSIGVMLLLLLLTA